MATPFFLENAHLRMRVTAAGAQVLSLVSLPLGLPVLRAGEGTGPGDCGLFPMLPLANRVAGNRFRLGGEEIVLPQSPVDEAFFLHGDGWVDEWSVVEHSTTHCLFRLQRRHACGFNYLARVGYRLRDAVLEVALTLMHLGESPMLYGGGMHPFFHFTSESTVQFSASGYWPEGEQHLPLAWRSDLPEEADFRQPQYGRDRWLNVCYSGWNGRASIAHPKMRVTLAASPGWLMLFRQPDLPFICLEPQSHPVNAHNMPGQPGLVLLQKGEEWHFSTSIIINQPGIG